MQEDDDTLQVIPLSELRIHLQRLEETIIFSLIERAQFNLNAPCYKKGDVIVKENPDVSFFEFFLKETEKVHAMVRRYTSPEEHAFFPESLPEPVLPLVVTYPQFVKPNHININQKIMRVYKSKLLPELCEEGDDKTNYGSSVVCDMTLLQAVSRRVHLGKQVAEVKFQGEQREDFVKAIKSQDAKRLMELVTHAEVEEKLLERLRVKAATYGRDITAVEPAEDDTYKVDPELIVSVYRDYIIPLTKEVQVLYLLQRLDISTHVAFLGPEGTFAHEAAQSFFSDSRSPVFTPCKSIYKVEEAIQSHEASYGVIPFSNCQTGKFSSTSDLLYETQLKVIGEVLIAVRLSLLSNCALQDITKVYSHPLAFGQCLRWLQINLPKAELIEVSSTAEGARRASEETNSAAIASQQSASQYNLKQLQVQCQDSQSSNVTRFLILSRNPRIECSSGSEHTLIRFVSSDRSGALMEALSIFSSHNVNIRSIESRFLQSVNEPAFLLELEGGRDENIRVSLEALEKCASSLTVLGSFRVAS